MDKYIHIAVLMYWCGSDSVLFLHTQLTCCYDTSVCYFNHPRQLLSKGGPERKQWTTETNQNQSIFQIYLQDIQWNVFPQAPPSDNQPNRTGCTWPDGRLLWAVCSGISNQTNEVACFETFLWQRHFTAMCCWRQFRWELSHAVPESVLVLNW